MDQHRAAERIRTAILLVLQLVMAAGDPSGLTDTMWDLIVDTLGAALISCFGWWHMKRQRRSFIEVWTDRFIERNPGLFGG